MLGYSHLFMSITLLLTPMAVQFMHSNTVAGLKFIAGMMAVSVICYIFLCVSISLCVSICVDRLIGCTGSFLDSGDD